MGWMKDETGLEKRAANYVPLTPLSHLVRAARVFPDRDAVVDRGFRTTYAQHVARVTRLASALANHGVQPGDVVATVLPNVLPAGRGAFRRAGLRRGPEHHQHRLDVGHGGLHPRPRRGEGGAGGQRSSSACRGG
jgi:hypothetical protein